MNCTVKENLDKILSNAFGVKEGDQIPSSISEEVSIKLDLLRNQFELYDFNKPLGEIKDGVLKYNHENLNELENLVDNFEEEFIADYESRFDGQINTYNYVDQEDLIDSDSDHFTDPHETKLGSGSSRRYAPVVNGNGVNPNPVNFTEWVVERENLLQRLKHLHSSLLKEGYKQNSAKVNKLNTIIQNLENEIFKYKSNDPTIIYSSIKTEIQTLKNVLTSAATDPVNSSIEFETSKVADRLNTLNEFFTGKDRLGTPIDITDPNAPGVLIYEKVKTLFDPDSYNEISKDIEELSMLYEIKVKDIIKGVFENNALVKEYIKTNKDWSTKEYKLEPLENGYKLVEVSQGNGKPILDILKEYLDKDLVGDVNLLGNTLGAASGGGILGDILHNIKTTYYNNELGSTAELKNKLSEDWKKVKDKTVTNPDGSTDLLSNKLFRKDINGVRVNQLVSAYSDKYFEDSRNNYEARTAFFKSIDKDATYSDWMTFEKEYTTKIDPRYLSQAKEAYKNTNIKGQFKSDAEIQVYEQQLRLALGDTLFEIETAKAFQKFNNYYEQLDNKGFTYIQEHTLNPFTFLDHYNSANFDKRDSSTNNFLLPDYVHSIPNITKNSYRNQEFYRDIETNPDLRNVWKGIFDLLEYSNPFLKSEGIQVSMLELPQYEDLLDREVTKDLTFFNKIPKFLKSAIDNIKKNYFDAWFTKEGKIKDETQQGTNVNVYYTTSPKILKKQMVNVLMQQSFDDLLKQFKEEGLQTNIVIDNTDNAATIRRKKSALANSIAQNRINKTSSSNIVESVLKLTEVINNAKARENTLGTYNLFKDFTRKAKLRGNSYVHDYINNWGETNIVKQKYYDAATVLGIGETKITKAGNKRVKYYNAKEKDLIEITKKLLDMKSGREFSGLNIGTLENPVYLEGKPGSYTISDKGVITTITEEEANIRFEEYANKLLDSLGIHLTVGSVLQGLANNIVRSTLAISLKGGISNRQVGYLANLKIASSGRYGFTEDNLHNARKFLLGTNALKYWEMAKKGLTGDKYNNKYTLRKSADIETVKMFVESMNMLQNRADELSLENRFGKSGVAVFTNNLKNLMFDANINNPEWHNQTEVILSVLNNTMVTTVSGEQKPFFDGKTTIFKPGTLELKDEFNTPENKRMWVDFEYDASGNNEHVTALGKISRAKEATQGNYNPEDLTPLQSTLTGKLGTIFMRYLPENTFNSWGHKKLDLRSGNINYKGSKLVLAEHTPTLAVYLGFVNTGKLLTLGATVGTLGATAATISLVSLLPGAIVAGVSLYYLRNHINLSLKNSRKEFLLAGDFAVEVAKRSMNSFVRGVSGGHLGLPQSFIDKKFVYQQENLTETERKILSESAQEVANKFMTYATFLTTAIILKSLYLLAVMGSDDDDEERLFKLKQLDGALNALQNIRENINEDIERYSNPSMFADAAMANVFLKNTVGWAADIQKVFEQYTKGTKDGSDVAFHFMKAPVVTVPRNVSKMLLTDQGIESLITDPTVYNDFGKRDVNFIGDKLIKNQGKPKEAIAKKEFEDKKRIVRNRAKDQISSILRKTDNYKEYQVEARTKELVDNFMKKYKKSKKNSYSTLNDSFNISDEYDRLEKYLDEVK